MSDNYYNNTFFRCGDNGFLNVTLGSVPPQGLYTCGLYQGRAERQTSSGSNVKVPKLLSIIVATVLLLLNVARAEIITNNTIGVSNLNVSEPLNMTQNYGSENSAYYVLPEHLSLNDVFHLFANTSAVIKEERTGLVYSDLELLPAN